MLAKRIIPCLDVKDGRVVKGVNFVGLCDAGDIVENAKYYNAAGADEVCFLDITATSDGRKTFAREVERAAKELFVPLTAGGGVSSVEDVRTLLLAGADKVSVNSAAIRSPRLIGAAAEKFGSQCIVVAIDAKRAGCGPDGLPKWSVFTHGGRVDTGIDAVAWAKAAQAAGAGEILLTSMDADGMKRLMKSLTRGRMHALGECVRQGYVPLAGGMRAGLSGRAIVQGGAVAGLDDISGVCIRVARDVEGAAAGVIGRIMRGDRVRSTLILSAPGLGKTTLLRDAARHMIRAGLNVAVADERGELAGPGMDMLPGADVMSMMRKADAINMLIRTMRPDVIVTDELGAEGDARAAADAVRCGTAILASAHARTIAHASARRELGEALRAGLFERIVIISGPCPGEGINVFDGRGNALC